MVIMLHLHYSTSNFHLLSLIFNVRENIIQERVIMQISNKVVRFKRWYSLLKLTYI